MQFVIVLATLVGVAYTASTFSDAELKEEWEQFKTTHSKSYDSDVHDSFRMKIYKENKNKITKHNKRFENGEVSFKLGVNQHADLLAHEFKSMLNGYNHALAKTRVKTNYHKVDSLVSRYGSVDWREKGYVTAVKNQGSCQSDWSFSSTGSLEGQLYKSTGKLVSLSEQNLIDCSIMYGNEGCHGGVMDYAFTFIQKYGGINSEASYPYTGNQGKCTYKFADSSGTDLGFYDIAESESALKHAVASVGPISVAIDASAESFQLYASGVYDEPSCSSTDLDRSMLVVGFGCELFGKDYWIVKNSIGTSWGEKGYIRMVRNSNNQCGIASRASFPAV